MKKSRIDLSIIILNYNTEGLLRDCLNSLKKSRAKGLEYEILVIDNASRDGSVTMVKREFPRVKLIKSKKNLGFAAGNNLGLPQAKGKYFLFLNPDTKVMTDTLKIMVDYLAAHPQVGVATCRVELPNGELDYPCHRGFPTPWNALAFFSGLAKLFPKVKIFNGYSLSYLPLDKIHEIDSGSGSFLMVRKKAGESLGWWDEDYFWYGEDLDFCYRLKQKGWQVMFVPTTKIVHYRGASSGIIKHSRKISTASKQTKLRASRASTEAMRIFFQKHYQGKYPRPIFWLVMKGISLLEGLRVVRASGKK